MTSHRSLTTCQLGCSSIASLLVKWQVPTIVGAEEIGDCIELVMRVLAKSKQSGFDLRSGITSVVPRSHIMHAIVTGLCNDALRPVSTLSIAVANDVTKRMIRLIAAYTTARGQSAFNIRSP